MADIANSQLVEKVMENQLSDKSKKFIDEIKLYLFSSGKNCQEIKEIMDVIE
jgi:hypothetical protein